MTQEAIFSDATQWGYFLEFEDVARTSLAALGELHASGHLAGGVVAFGPDCWRQAGPDWTPEGFAAFEPVTGPNHAAPATQRDLLVWLRNDDQNALFDDARAVTEALAPYARLADATFGFDYRDSHDLIGFEDGTGNPKGDARRDAALVPVGSTGAGGAFVFTQKWQHDLKAFNALDVAAQERVVGRTKADSIELTGDAMPATSHVSRTDLKVDGVAQKIFRRSMPYGDPATHGLFFIAFACEQSRVQVQLDSMYDVSHSGVQDALLDFSQAVSGAYWFAPAADVLAAMLKS